MDTYPDEPCIIVGETTANSHRGLYMVHLGMAGKVPVVGAAAPGSG
jgi:hypothetical protein